MPLTISRWYQRHRIRQVCSKQDSRNQMLPGKPHRKRIFTPSDDALIREQPATGLGLKTLETMLRTSRDTLLRRADELGVLLLISNDHDHDGAIDTRRLRRTDGIVDPLLERLKQVHGLRK